MAATSSSVSQSATREQPRPSGFAHVSVPVRDREEAKRFFMNVLGGELKLDIPTFCEVVVGSMIFGFSEQKGGWTAPDAEFPHYAFYVDPDDFVPLKERLKANGVPTHPIWSRGGVEALMYFRDPSGNLFELYCTQGFKDADKLPGARGSGI